MPQGMMLLGLLAGVAIAALLLKHSEEESDVGLLDYVGDIWVQLTTTEESRIAQLQPDVQAELRLLLSDLFAAGLPVEVGSTLRTSAKEKALIAAGKTSGSLKISWHQLGRAVDLYPLDENGTADRNGVHTELFRRMHEIAEARGWHGIAFNADGSKHYLTNSAGKLVWDGGHLQWESPYGSIVEAVQAEGAEYGLA